MENSVEKVENTVGKPASFSQNRWKTMWKVWITAFENVDFTHFSTFLPVENTVFVNYLTIAVGLCQVFFCYKKWEFLLKI